MNGIRGDHVERSQSEGKGQLQNDHSHMWGKEAIRVQRQDNRTTDPQN